MPTLIATGVFAQRPFSMVEKTVINAVAVIKASYGMPVLLIIIAFTGTIYIIAKNVVSPAPNSCFTLVLFCAKSKNFTPSSFSKF